MKVAVGSKNPVKIEAARLAFTALWPKEQWEVTGADIKSGISDQPMSDRESIRGASNRAKRALQAQNADFGVGFEGGLQKIGKEWFDCGWAVVLDKKGVRGVGSSAKIQMSEKMMQLIFDGKELGEVSDILFKETNSKHGAGHFGLMTNNAITREQGYRDGLIMALSRFLHPKLFENGK